MPFKCSIIENVLTLSQSLNLLYLMNAKFYISLWMFIAFVTTSTAQLKITEISYNPPESGNDTLEYIEIYNAGNSILNLKDYKFTKGVEHTFEELLLHPDTYLVIAVNADAFERNYKVPAIQWNSGALNNNGEVIAIANADGVEVISVDLKDVAPWPGFADGTDGNGRSIEICDPNSDPNDGKNWKVSENDLGFQINNKQIYGTPGSTNSITCTVEADYLIEVTSNGFTPTDITIEIGETVRWTNMDGNNNINGEISIFPDNPVSFGNGDPSTDSWSYDFTFDVPGYYAFQSDPTGITGSVTVLDKPVVDPYPFRTIAEVKGVNNDGVADSLGIKCTLEGIVHSINFRPNGLQFAILDADNKGFSVFSNANNFGYTVTPGDRVRLKGKIGQFRGLSQLELDSLSVISTDNVLLDPILVNEFTEELESSYVTLLYVSFIDKEQWNNSGSGFNVIMTDDVNEFTVRIVNTSDAYTNSVPSAYKFNVTGILTQFAQSNPPFSDGYQLQPSYFTDFHPILATDDLAAINVLVSPNPVSHQITIISEQIPEKIDVLDVQGRIVKSVTNSNMVDFSALNPSTYLLKINIHNKQVIKRIIKF